MKYEFRMSKFEFRRLAVCAARLAPGFVLAALAGWAFGQGFEVKTTDGTSDVQRFRIETSGGVGAAARSYFLNANIGIGTNSASAKLHIGSGAGAEVLVDNASEWQAKDSGGAVQGFLWPRWTDDVTYLNFGTGGFNVRNNASTNVMFLQDGGNVGIGTTSPSAKLHVTDNLIAGSSLGTPAKLNLDYPAGHVTIHSPGYLFLTSQNNNHMPANLYWDGANWNRYDTAGGGAFWWAGSDGSLRAYQTTAGANPVMTFTIPLAIDLEGQTGLGTTTPGARLEVVADSTTWGGWNEAIRLKPDAHAAITQPGAGLLFGMHGNRYMYWADTTNAWYSMYLEPSGELTVRDKVLIDGTDNGWGNTVINGRVWSANSNIHLSPPNGFWVYINDDYREAGGAGGGTAGLQVDGNVRLCTAGGTCGINKASPAGRLHVGGDIYSDAHYYAGYDDTSTNGSQFVAYRGNGTSARANSAYFDCYFHATFGNSFRIVSNGTVVAYASYFEYFKLNRDLYQFDWDLAELYLTKEKDLDGGDVVAADPANRLHLKRAARPYDGTAMGIVSTDPAQVMGYDTVSPNIDQDAGEFEQRLDDSGEMKNIPWKPVGRTREARPLALAGRVPCRVTGENGPIELGDWVTTSSTPGAAMRLELLDAGEAKDPADYLRIQAENVRRRAAVLGKALERFDGKGEGRIEVLVTP